MIKFRAHPSGGGRARQRHLVAGTSGQQDDRRVISLLHVGSIFSPIVWSE